MILNASFPFVGNLVKLLNLSPGNARRHDDSKLEMALDFLQAKRYMLTRSTLDRETTPVRQGADREVALPPSRFLQVNLLDQGPFVFRCLPLPASRSRFLGDTISSRVKDASPPDPDRKDRPEVRCRPTEG